MKPDSHDIVRNVSGVLPVMRDRGLWQFRGGSTMGEGHRPERGVADWREVKVERGVLRKLVHIM
ncbi:MAG TPA: hypothetical protein VH114_07685, partial [Candidatus Acidoferrum sp.]|nr:hypothetical protein [Candidatus Acidoferrum sp.]